MDAVPQYPLYGSTFNVYSISPLYHGRSQLLLDASLRSHARRLRNVLKGDTLRGVHIGVAATDNAIANLGPLESCTWDLIGDEASWEETHASDEHDEMSDDLAPGGKPISPEVTRGIHIQLQYLQTTHTGLLLRNPASKPPPNGFTSMPLLLLRMPQPVREVVLEYLTTTFDTRISPLKFRSEFLLSSLESLLAHITDHESPETIPDIVKPLQIQLAFPQFTQYVKHIDITIARDDLHEFVCRGQQLNAGSNAPLTTALELYLSSHLALDTKYIRSGISKAICGLFALSSEGKLKLFAPAPRSSDTSEDERDTLSPSASQLFMRDFYSRLVSEASTPLQLLSSTIPGAKAKEPSRPAPRRKREATTDVENGAKQRRPQARVQDDELADANDAHTVRSTNTPARLSVPVDPPPPYELHDPARSQRAGSQPGPA
ncbi:hypothetical protein EJ05DRAFT_535412 [Pseudovirgaria hyperparasitica]|uniref:Uncharacterized protein n=1 Tax=Pseudovirgaria hyperparasitica TaxID=470096 RepID=A0A6A6WJ36_9PEZI|nr:uncharacterized protein EJ05DRAFT_535412 [Pseudovirgaria hyperparasitica]KAF2762146.1 hypothetical protein EJ05DRAFT_535412 [Pseudovirgaria hyperparasitica]